MLPEPFDSDCGTKPYNVIIEKSKYTKGLCIIDCKQSLILEECGCVGEEYAEISRQGKDALKLSQS